MDRLRLDRLLEMLSRVELVVACLWIGLAAISVALLVLMHTRWGQSHPLRKCLILSFLAHAILGTYATTVKITFSPPAQGREEVVQVATVDVGVKDTRENPALGQRDAAQEKPWEMFAQDATPAPDPVELPRAEMAPPAEVQRETGTEPSALPAVDPAEHLAITETARPQPEDLPATPTEAKTAPGKSPETIEVPTAQHREGPKADLPGQPTVERYAGGETASPSPTRTTQPGLPSALLQRPLSVPRLDNASQAVQPENALDVGDSQRIQSARGTPAQDIGAGLSEGASAPMGATAAGRGSPNAEAMHVPPPSLATSGAGGRTDAITGLSAGVGPPRLSAPSRGHGQDSIPEIYQLRVAPDRSQQIQKHGGTNESEQAVRAALKWLADNQSPSGAWIARDHGAGEEKKILGRDRRGAGADADTGMTGLALLAFLAAGHTHQEGKYQTTVGRGLDYLLATQADDGNLAGMAKDYAAMYCHAMGTIALSEAYAMTSDSRLREPVRLAVAYTLSMQNPTTGGWRYKRGDDGDTSQLGWQLMALKSAQLAGIPVPQNAWRGAAQFLQRISSGSYGGLGSYRPGERVSFAMTAEALVCRQFLGLNPTSSTAKEAGDHLLRELPGESKPPNLYYWYYGTLGMYQMQGSHWQRWNEALQRTLLASQRRDGSLAGSWDTSTLWGGYGGRVYTTAIATLSLEVYYRYLPIYERIQASE